LHTFFVHSNHCLSQRLLFRMKNAVGMAVRRRVGWLHVLRMAATAERTCGSVAVEAAGTLFQGSFGTLASEPHVISTRYELGDLYKKISKSEEPFPNL
jgi:hypothetical protein